MTVLAIQVKDAYKMQYSDIYKKVIILHYPIFHNLFVWKIDTPLLTSHLFMNIDHKENSNYLTVYSVIIYFNKAPFSSEVIALQQGIAFYWGRNIYATCY